jgi:hypothetical protein
MCAFYHKPEEKQIVEQESMDFYDPFLEEYGEGEEQEEISDEKSDKNSNSSNTIPQDDLEIPDDDSSPKPTTHISASSINGESEEITGENAWTNDEFGLEAALQKTRSQINYKEDMDNIDLDADPDPLPKPHTTDNTSNTPLSGAEDTVNHEISRKEEHVSTEIFSLAMGNSQQIETAKIVEKITSKASSRSKSKFFNNDDSDNERAEANDVIHDILTTDFTEFMLAPEDSNKPKIPLSTSNFYTFREVNGLPVVKEEGYTPDSSANKNGLNDIFDFNPVHRSTYSFGDKNTMLPFDIYNEES